MDQRIHDHAEILVDWSARVDAGDDVVLSVGEGAHDLGVAVARRLGERDANMLATYSSDELDRAYLRAHSGAFESDPEFEVALYEHADVVLSLRGTRNTTEQADVSDETQRNHAQASRKIRELRMDTDWVSTVHPTRAMAQQAGMSFEAYTDFVYDAILRDWESLAEEMSRLKTILDEGSEVRVLKEHDLTDLTLSIENRTAVNSAASVAYDSHNLPSGEVFTAPRDTAGQGVFDVPMTIRGKRVRNARLAFKDGVVVDWEAAEGEDVLRTIIETDEGSRRLGELGVGMNRGIDRVTDQILFDEKLGGTVHMALGRSYDANLPESEDGNDSAVHVDLITDMRADGTRMEVDGETIQRDGVFRWEEGFEE
ncbi:aminopeptidase [Halobacteriales archaeon SW_10_66_29]|nr:MAG: aminopeptidase [Halobacteriales archaeon SW_10_66_29]